MALTIGIHIDPDLQNLQNLQKLQSGLGNGHRPYLHNRHIKTRRPYWLLAWQRPAEQQPPTFRCGECGGPVRTVAVTDGLGQVIYGSLQLKRDPYRNGVGYRDSG